MKHDGKDVYCGVPSGSYKSTYHESGKRHTHSHIGRNILAPGFPLAKIKGYAHLNTFGFPNSNQTFLELTRAFREYKGKKSHASLIIDGRTIPKDAFVNVEVGMLEPKKLEALNRGPNLKSIMVATDTEPWIYAALFW